MENMTLEQLIATFGAEVGQQMFDQMNASNSGGNKAPFTFIKKIAQHGSELGAFGEYAVGVETEKQPDGTRAVTNKGTNLGTDFEFIIVNVGYKYRKWDQAANNGKGRTLQSNMFASLDGIKTAVNAFTGKPLPTSKEDKKADEWKLTRINAGLVRKNSKSAWTQCIWEVDGSLYFTLGEVVGNQRNGGLMSGIVKVQTKLDSKGATQFSVIDVDASEFVEKNIFEDKKVTPLLGDITTKMSEYRDRSQYTGATPAAPAPQGGGEGHSESDETNW